MPCPPSLDQLSYRRCGQLTRRYPTRLCAVGAGHNGLSSAARLQALGVKVLVIDREQRIGDNWRLRYEALSLHFPHWADHLAYMPFPPNWPVRPC